MKNASMALWVACATKVLSRFDFRIGPNVCTLSANFYLGVWLLSIHNMCMYLGISSIDLAVIILALLSLKLGSVLFDFRNNLILLPRNKEVNKNIYTMAYVLDMSTKYKVLNILFKSVIIIAIILNLCPYLTIP